MPSAIRVEGDPAAQLRRLSRDLRATGNAALRRELNKSLTVAAQPLIEAAKASAAGELPKGGGRGVRSFNRKTGARQNKLKTKGFANRGGTSSRVESLSSRVVNAKYKVKVKAGRNPGVVLTATGSKGRKIDLNQLDSGIVRHPLFGNREHWYSQPVPPGWWSRPMEAGVPAVTVAVKAAVDKAVAAFYDMF